MNYRGSYRRLLGNAKAAMVAAIEIYNKPAFQYRDECFVILLLNAWELVLKAVLSKNKQSIFYPKKRKEPYRTLSWQDAVRKAERFFPRSVPPRPVRGNLEFLGTYRDNAVHFYNSQGFGVLIYALAQTSIKNFRDLLHGVFNMKLEDAVNWHLLPLGVQPPVDPITYIASAQQGTRRLPSAVRQFLTELGRAVKELEADAQDTGRLLTVFSVKLESVKKIENADLRIGVESASETAGPLAIVKVRDPNVTHPLRQKDVVGKIEALHGKPFTSYTFQALAHGFKLKENPQYCWQAKEEGVLIRYSHDVVAWIKRRTAADVEHVLHEYAAYLRKRRQGRDRGATA